MKVIIIVWTVLIVWNWKGCPTQSSSQTLPFGKCNDKNSINGDGCTNWIIDNCWEWTGFYSNWVKISMNWENSSISEKWGNGVISQSEECDDQNIVNKDGWSSECKIEDFHICSGEPSVCRKSTYQTISTTEKVIGTSIQGSIGGAFITSMLLSGFLNLSTKGLWSLINMLQILNYLPMFTLFYSQNVLKIFSFTAMANFDMSYMSDIFMLHVDENKLENREQVDYRYENQGYESTSFLINASDTLSFLGILIIYQLFMLGIYLLIK